ncbi:MAG TPA: mevalonate kinase [Erysipelothrix sp.]
MRQAVKSKRHGKIILMGEHSVVYQKPAIALPFKAVNTNVIIQENDKQAIETSTYFGSIAKLSDDYLGIKTLIMAMIEKFSLEADNFLIKIESTIPIQRGLGSSAAVSIALVDAFDEYFKLSLDDHEKIQLFHISESIHHRNPSGIDTRVIYENKAILFEKNQKIITFSPDISAYLVVADTGITGDTSIAVNKVKEKIATDDSAVQKIEKLGILTKNTYHSLLVNNIKEIGLNMTEAHKILKALGVSHTKLDQFVNLSINNQALGAKLTGGGLGGCMIALVDSKEKAHKLQTILENNGAVATWKFQLKEMTK